MCNDEKLLKHQLKNKRKAKYEMGNFCEQYRLPPITPFRQKVKNMTKAIKNIKNTKITLLNLMISMLRRKISLKNMLNKDQVKVNVLTMVNLDTLVKTVKKNLVS